jgi:DNA polymerase-3 subunit epsilon
MIELFLDTETTGLSYSNNHKIIEIACVETEDLIPTKNIFHKLINPKRDVPNEAYKIHGLSSELLNTKETFDKIADEFKNFIKDKKLIIHNAPFDIGFLNHELRLVKVEEIKKNQVIDTLDLARSMYPGTSNSLDALCRKFNIDLTRRTKHNALLDCELLREVYINLIGVKEPKLIFSNEEEIKVSEIKNTKDYSKRVVQLTTEETENHKNFIKKEIKKNYY